jgi:hypothetical protein
MSLPTDDEIAYEEFVDSLYRQWEEENAEEIKEKGIQDFLDGLLTSFLTANPNLAEAPLRRLAEARSLLTVNDSACLALGYSAIEIGFKNLLMRPMIVGFVHKANAASLIAEVVISRSHPSHLRKILEETLSYIKVTDHGTLKIAQHQDSLWGHMERLRDARNRVLHRGEAATHDDADASIRIGSTIIEKVFPRLLNVINLKLENGVILAVQGSGQDRVHDSCLTPILFLCSGLYHGS